MSFSYFTLFASPYFDHDAFMHHTLHVLDASGNRERQRKTQRKTQRETDRESETKTDRGRLSHTETDRGRQETDR